MKTGIAWAWILVGLTICIINVIVPGVNLPVAFGSGLMIGWGISSLRRRHRELERELT